MILINISGAMWNTHLDTDNRDAYTIGNGKVRGSVKERLQELDVTMAL